MNCREFRKKHDAYIDDTLNGVDIERMGSHLRFCERCAQQDTRVRRALLVARNVPLIHPSADFGARLQARIVAERGLQLHTDSAQPSSRLRTLTPATYVMIAAGLLFAGGIAGAATYVNASHEVLRMAPVVATLPEPAPEPSVFATPTMVAAMPTGIPMWSAVLVAQEAPWHLASDVAGR